LKPEEPGKRCTKIGIVQLWGKKGFFVPGDGAASEGRGGGERRLLDWGGKKTGGGREVMCHGLAGGKKKKGNPLAAKGGVTCGKIRPLQKRECQSVSMGGGWGLPTGGGGGVNRL